MITKKYKEILENIKRYYNQNKCDEAYNETEHITNMSVETLRKGFVKYFDRNTVSFAGRRVLKLPYGKYDPIDGFDIYREKPTLYVSISHVDKNGFSLSTPDDEKYADVIHINYKFVLEFDENRNITKFAVNPELYYTS